MLPTKGPMRPASTSPTLHRGQAVVASGTEVPMVASELAHSLIRPRRRMGVTGRPYARRILDEVPLRLSKHEPLLSAVPVKVTLQGPSEGHIVATVVPFECPLRPIQEGRQSVFVVPSLATVRRLRP